jgi:AI-2 transport protein TqsA
MTKALVVTAAIVLIVAGIKAAEDIAVPFLLAAFLATIASTPVFWLHRAKIPIGIAIFVVVLILIGIMIGVGAIVAHSAAEFTAQLPHYEERVAVFVNAFFKTLESHELTISPEAINKVFNPAIALSFAGNTLLSFGNVLSNAFLILLTVIFILAEASSFPRKLGEVLRNPEHDLPHFVRFAATINRYMAIKTSVSVATGIIVTIFLSIIGVDFPILWGMLAFMLNYVPTIGSVIAAVPAILLATLQLGPAVAGIVATGYLALNICMGNIIEPRFMGRELGLSTLVVFLSLVFWGWMLGPVGMLLSVPLTMTAKIALETSPSTAWIGHLLGPAEKASDKESLEVQSE